MQLIKIDENQNVQYYESCKLRMDKNKKVLIIMPSEKGKQIFYSWDFNSNFKLISSILEAEFIHVALERTFLNIFQRILCIDKNETDSNKYFIIFSNIQKLDAFIELANKFKEV